MTAALRAGLAYFLIVFAIGFGLGTLRTLVIVPRVGELVAVCLELPLMLGASWLVCRRLVRRVAPAAAPRLVMGGTAFALLILAEFALAVLAFGQAPAAYAARLSSPAGLIGFAGQVIFALMPLIHHAHGGAQRHR